MISYKKIDKSEGTDFNKGENSVKWMICNYCYFKNIRFKYQLYICNGCHDFSMTVQNLNDFFVVTIKNVDYRLYITGVDKKADIFIFKNSDLSDKGVLQMDFGPNISPVEVIKKGTFGGTYFRDIYSGLNDKFYKNSWKEFKELENIDNKYYA